MIGYSPIEILGTCGYDYCHHDDLENLIDCHKKLLQNGAVPLIAYRFRTKGDQWMWVQSRFQMLNHHVNKKPYLIMAHNHIVSLNEMIESQDILDNSSIGKFNSPTTLPKESLDCMIIDTKSDQNQNHLNGQMLSPDINNQQRRNSNQNMISPDQNKTKYQLSPNMSQKQFNTGTQQSQQQRSYSPPKPPQPGPPVLPTLSTKTDRHIDESLGVCLNYH